MATWRFTLAGMLGSIAVVAVACAALANPSPIWAALVVTAVLGLLTYAVLAAIFRRGARRAFWIGLATVGWGYTYLVAHDRLGNSMNWNNGSVSGFASAPSQLVTTKLLLWWAGKLAQPGPPFSAYAPSVTYSAPAYPAELAPVTVEPDPLVSPQSPTYGTPDSAPTVIPGPYNPPIPGPYNPPAVAQMPGVPISSPVVYTEFDGEMFLRLLTIGEHLWALLLGLLGGLIARSMYLSGQRQGALLRDGET